ncbi:response regulator transcription factor [Nocardioides sp. GY 10127]|uniref:response regulator transcription factor n=1 Tax=Nocardioides sp. GY 10127 TaxID=2569762 RepID=UPI001F0FEB36|nr:response regulator transcription factor [Nocardioides sp. GY 10127]
MSGPGPGAGAAAGTGVRVGVCEDDAAIRRVLRAALEQAGHEVVMTHDGGEARRVLATAPIDVLVLDIGLPDADGRDVCQALRAAGQQAPVLFLTAYDAPQDVAAGFHAGGDDYVVKPFELTEVLLRVAALARRYRPVRAASASGLDLDPARHALVGEREVTLTPTEFRLLAALAGRPGEVVRRAELVAAAWPDGAWVSENTLDSFVRRVRTKLADAGAPAVIETVRGVGLVLR